MAKIRVGIVGSGFGGVVHAPAFHAHEAFELVAIASPNRAEAVAKERNIPNAFPSLEAMLDGIELDAVSISSPPFAHHDAVLLALSRSKHVLCEKPLARTVAEAEEMVAAAKKSGQGDRNRIRVSLRPLASSPQRAGRQQSSRAAARDRVHASHDDAATRWRSQARLVVRIRARRRDHSSHRLAHDRQRNVAGRTSPAFLHRILANCQLHAQRR